ncbi:MAG: hypothetical protein OXD29_02070 [Roseovarius sp.]|nr:hypothetical protein [Roseovarius sp.]MCY4206722.1 hypothetical protein [Roseovarius sp.]MCY4290901.1 hypothetical protein [Roseovarius sp.]MCY4316504.1 hypothetical protein [Roseovarius sp.]
MPDSSRDIEPRISAHVLRPAMIIRTACQMMLGAGLTITLVIKIYMLVLTDYQCDINALSLGNSIRCRGVLEITSYTLALAAGFELGHLLFRDTMEKAVRPLLLGTSAAIIMTLSNLVEGNSNWTIALIIAVLSIALFGGMAFYRWTLQKLEGEVYKNSGGD